MTATEPIADRRWYRRTLFGVVLTVWGVLFCFFALMILAVAFLIATIASFAQGR